MGIRFTYRQLTSALALRSPFLPHNAAFSFCFGRATECFAWPVACLLRYSTVKHGIREETISMKIANRKAKDDRESGLNALEAYANMGVTPENWKRFHLKFPEFFPKNLSEWFYSFAELWAWRYDNDFKAWLKPPLLFYRDRLQSVWALDDPEGVCLKLLLGFEKELGRRNFSGKLLLPAKFGDKRGRGLPDIVADIPGQPVDREMQTTYAGLPPGKPIVDGVTGAITWKFGCTLQQSVYELMQQRWRAMVCPECGKFFLADKTRQTYCSSVCFGEMKRKRALDYWNRVGRAERDRRVKEKRRKS